MRTWAPGPAPPGSFSAAAVALPLSLFASVNPVKTAGMIQNLGIAVGPAIGVPVLGLALLAATPILNLLLGSQGLTPAQERFIQGPYAAAMKAAFGGRMPVPVSPALPGPLVGPPTAVPAGYTQAQLVSLFGQEHALKDPLTGEYIAADGDVLINNVPGITPGWYSPSDAAIIQHVYHTMAFGPAALGAGGATYLPGISDVTVYDGGGGGGGDH